MDYGVKCFSITINTDIFVKSIGLNNSVNKNDMQLQHE